MQSAAEIEDKVRDYIVRNLMLKHSGGELSPDQPLLETGIMTSFGIVELVAYLEQTFSVRIDDDDVVPENFQTVRSITDMIQEKRGNSP